ncbi:unnamed protein product [Acanthoscelides obtectus]|uniref:Sarcospan n=1 Tax=Acanthoscelides obtectus TaxID=200917 RepID=A0A9P0NU16_ACAOB|nr:unnamed protein product [Acanthoscelides obtectus]CAK1668201.1 hypothetical protein AOBTE_LOCUS26277 [Acanthoscelides obtectus]
MEPDPLDTSRQSNSRPVSYYENNQQASESRLSSEGKAASNNNLNRFTKSPTQTHCLNTTVPQNIAAPDFGGRHQPTRNSLRHSRMIVLNRSGQAVTPNDIPLLKHRKLVKAFLILTLLIGIFLCLISLWFLVWSPNLRQRDNPCWSALPILMSGIVGLLYLHYCPKLHPSRLLSYLIKSLKYLSVCLSVLACITALSAFFIALMHIVAISITSCAPPSKASSTCLCDTGSNRTQDTMFDASFHYLDLNCFEVDVVLRSIIAVVCLINGMAFIFGSFYLYLQWTGRNTHFYSRVPTAINGKEMKVFKSNS